MPLQRRLFQAMLALLGLAALAGASILLFPAKAFAGAVALTLVASALAAGGAIRFANMLTRRDDRPAGLFGLATIIGFFVISTACIWIAYFVNRWEFEFFLTALVAFGACICLNAGYALWHSTAGRFSGCAGLAFTVATMLSTWILIWLDRASLNSYRQTFEILTGAIATPAIPLCCCLFGQLRTHPWRWFGTLCGVAVLAAGLYAAAVGRTQPNSWYNELLLLCFAIGIANLTARIRLSGRQVWVRALTLLAMAATVGCASVLIFEPSFDAEFGRFTVAGLIVTVCGILACLVLFAMNRRLAPSEAPSVSSIAAVRLNCPHCGLLQEAPVGDSLCRGCNLILSIRVSEPRCAQCNYLLLKLPSPVCPECGQAFTLESSRSAS